MVSGADDTNLKVWDFKSTTTCRQALTTLKAHTASITCVEISPDSTVVISGSEDGELIMHDLAQFKVIRQFKVGSAQSAYPVSLGLQRHSQLNVLTGMAVGLLNKTIKYFKVDQN